MTSLNTQVKRVSALIGTKDLSDWESDFVASIADKTKDSDS